MNPALFSVSADEVNTIHLQIGVAADTLPPADGRQVPVVMIEPPEIDSGGQRGDLTLKKVTRPRLVHTAAAASAQLFLD